MKSIHNTFFVYGSLLALPLLWLVGCAETPTKFDDPSMSIDALVGQEFKITMQANPTTGYQWQLAKPLDETKVKLLGSQYRRDEPTLAGSGGAEVWTFRGIAKGRTDISFKYVRPWETNAAPARSETYTVNDRP